MTKRIKLVNQPLNAEGLLSLNLQEFSEPPTPPIETPPAGGEPPVPPVPPVPPAETPPVTPDKTFTQTDVNNLVAKESKTAQEKLLKKLGIEDFDSAKDGLEKFREWQESQKSEAEKQAEALKALETEKESMLTENQTLKAQLSAVKAGVLADSVPDVVTLAKTMVTEEMDMDAAIAAVVEKYPHFAQVVEQVDPDAPPKPQFSNGQHQTQPQSETDKWLAAFKQ
ncbi:hypothetical protein [Sporosarcina sp. FSL K6-3457]|uniref:hypothetical protein n=1 Tax=Sporosarcina sp. FSL K6-3457 TaxID=2978204 RepID=UPI0030F70127